MAKSAQYIPMLNTVSFFFFLKKERENEEDRKCKFFKATHTNLDNRHYQFKKKQWAQYNRREPMFQDLLKFRIKLHDFRLSPWNLVKLAKSWKKEGERWLVNLDKLSTSLNTWSTVNREKQHLFDFQKISPKLKPHTWIISIRNHSQSKKYISVIANCSTVRRRN